MISIRYDPFGPPIIFKHRDFDDKFNDLTVDETFRLRLIMLPEEQWTG